MEETWLILVNPNSGKQKGAKEWNSISEYLVQKGVYFKALFTRHKKHAIQLTKTYVKKGFRKFLVVGGDGTLNEVINGVMLQKFCPSQDITVGIIPVGTGNDWCKTFAIDNDYKKAIDVIVKGKTFLQDVGVVSYMEDNVPTKRYIINSAGIGFEALVVKATNQQKESGKNNSVMYLHNVLRYVRSFKGLNATVDIDGVIANCNFYMFSIGICRFKGNGMKLLPYAIPDDGKFDVTMVKIAPLFTLLRNMPRMIKGNFKNVKIVSTCQCEKVTVNSDDSTMIMEVDGESLGNNPYVFEIIPAAVNMVINYPIWEKE